MGRARRDSNGRNLGVFVVAERAHRHVEGARKLILLLALGGCSSGAAEWLSLFPGHEAARWSERWAAAVRVGRENGPAPVSAVCEHLKSASGAKKELLRALGKQVASLADADALTVSSAAGDFRLALDVVRGRGEVALAVELEGGDDIRLSLSGKKLVLRLGGKEEGETELALGRKRRVELRREADIVRLLVDGAEVVRKRLVFRDDAPEKVSVRGADGVALARISWAARPAPVRSVERAAADKMALVALRAARAADEESRHKAFLEAKALYLRAAKKLKNSPLYPRTSDGFTVGRHRAAECLYKAGVCAVELGKRAEAKNLFARCVRTDVRGPWQERADLELAGLALGHDFPAAMDHIYRILFERGRRAETIEEAFGLAMEALAQKAEPQEAIFQLKRLNAHIEWLGWPMEWGARFLFKLGEIYELQEKPHDAERVWRALRRRAFRAFPESARAADKLEAFPVDRPAGGK